jgi:HEAT repeat protein
MFRTARQIAPWLSLFLRGCATASAIAIATAAVVACSDENDPATYVKRLDDPATRAPAVSRLIQFYEDKMGIDNQDRNGPNVKPLLELIVQPLTQRCVEGDLDERTNSKLITFLSSTKDPRAEACILKALKSYTPDKTEDDVRNACRAVAAMKLKSAAGPLMDVFTKIHASRPKAQSTYRDVHDAMVALQDPSWEPQLIQYLNRPLDSKDQAVINDEMFWEITAAEVLGFMKSEKAVRPLLKLMLSPMKGAGQGDAVLALVKIGKPAIGPTVALLRGTDKDLVDYSKAEVVKAAAGDKQAEKGAASAYVGAAALVLATIGREETAGPLIEAVGTIDDGVAKAVIARELTKVPRSDKTIKAFKDIFEKLPTNLSIPNSRGGAREVLLDVVANFFDASFVPWIVGTLKSMKGDEGDLAPIRERAMEAILKIATRDQVKFIDEVASMKASEGTVGKGYEKEIKLVKDLLATCGDKFDCYLGKLSDPSIQTDDKQLVGIKSAYMLGVLGGADVPKKIMAVYPKISNLGIRFAALTAIDALSPRGNTEIANTLQKIVDDAIAARDQEKQRFSPTLKQFIYRLNARSQ